MRPFFGVLLELAALVLLLEAISRLGVWYPLSVLVLVLGQVLTTILVHCPAHYVVGSALGIGFSKMRLGRSTAVKVLPPSFRQIGVLLIVFSLSVDRESKRTVSPRRMRGMYLAGVAVSVGSAIAFAVAVSFAGSFVASSVTWFFALGYLVSDIKLSPRFGDLMRARAVVTPKP